MTTTELSPKTKPGVTGLEGFILLLIGQTISLFGSGLTAFALDIWVFLETGSVTLFGLVTVLGVVPNILVSPFAGALVDRWDRRKVIIISDTVSAGCTLILAILLYTDQLAVIHVALISIVMSLMGAFQRPAYVATTPLLVPKKHYARINGVAAMIGASAQILAPTMAAFLILAINLWGVLIVDFVTYFIALGILSRIHIPRPKASLAGQSKTSRLRDEILHGWRYLRERSGLFALMVFATLNNFFVGVLITLMTPMALSLYDARVLGLVLSTGGIGLLLGGIIMTFWRGPRRRIYGILAVYIVSALCVMMVGIEPVPGVFYAAAFLFFMGIPIVDGLAATIWYSKIHPDVQGRARAVRQAFSWSLLPVSYVMTGLLADNIFEPAFAEGGVLAQTVLGDLVGIGPGYGLAFMFALTGLFLLILAAGSLLNPRLRNIEEEIEDVVTDTPDEMLESQEEVIVEERDLKFGLSRPFRVILTSVLAVVLLLVVAGVLISVLTVRQPFPQTEGTLTVSGLQEPVTVRRDSYGVPHLYAENQEDMFFAQGFTHAQERFWQMESQRLVAKGRTAELYGEFTLDLDIDARNIGWYRIAQATWQMYQQTDPEAVAALEAYSAGVNAYLDENRDSFNLNLTIWNAIGEPWEIDPWQPADSLAIGVLLDWDLGGGVYREQERAILSERLGPAAAAALWPYYSPDYPYILPDGGVPITQTTQINDKFVSNRDLSQFTFIGSAARTPFSIGQHPFSGSNSWVISGEHTENGLPLLANDPHIALEIPSRWFEMGLHAPSDWDVVGFSLPGIPTVLIGRNQHIAWGLTNARVDTQDLFIEKINPNNPNQYEFQGEWRDMEIIEETILVAEREPLVLEVQLTHHGPLVAIPDPRMTEAMSMAWTGSGTTRVFKAAILLNKAQNYDDFLEAMRLWDTLSQSIVYADVDGNIAYQLPGRIPVRPRSDGQFPVPGWTGEYDWAGWVPFDELPRALNPESGYIIAANNAIVSEAYPHVISKEWAAGERAARIEEMILATLTTQGVITTDDMARIQLDTKTLLAADYVPLLLSLNPTSDQMEEALRYLSEWDHQEQRDSVATTIFEIFYMHLAETVLADELGDISDVYLFDGNAQRMFFHHLASDEDAIWWDDVTTEQMETRDDILHNALEETVIWLERKLGKNMAGWQWGELHTITFENVPLGRFGIPAIAVLLNRGPYSIDGGNSVINATGWNWENPAPSRSGVSFRLIVDLSDVDKAQAIHATGQSGHPYHPHYTDFIEMWVEGEYHPVYLSEAAIAEQVVEQLILVPAE